MCSSCQAVKINGVLCHEHECPDTWKDYKRECKWCGQKFTPEYRNQNCCNESCECAYYGYPDSDEEYSKE
jgi:hypothetical protein